MGARSSVRDLRLFRVRVPFGRITTGAQYEMLDQQYDPNEHERFFTEDAIVAAGGCKPNFALAYPSWWALVGASFVLRG